MNEDVLNGFIDELTDELNHYATGLTMSEECLNKVVDIACRYANYQMQMQ